MFDRLPLSPVQKKVEVRLIYVKHSDVNNDRVLGITNHFQAVTKVV